MNITFLKRNSDEAKIDFVSLLKSEHIHYVSVAVPGLTVPSYAVEFAGDFDINQRRGFMYKVNEAKETGTLYPKVNITLVPSPVGNYTSEFIHHHDGDYSESEIIVHLSDAFKANALYIKSDTMYFDFRNVCTEHLYISALKKTVDQQNQDRLPKNIITWEAPTIE